MERRGDVAGKRLDVVFDLRYQYGIYTMRKCRSRYMVNLLYWISMEFMQ